MEKITENNLSVNELMEKLVKWESLKNDFNIAARNIYMDGTGMLNLTTKPEIIQTTK